MVTETGMLLAILIVHEIIPAVQVAAVDPAHQDWAASGAQAVHVVGTMHHDVAWPAVPKRCSVLAHVAAAGNDVVRFLRSVRMRRVHVVRPDPHEANCCGTAWAAVPSDRVGSSSANHDGRGVCFATGVRRYPLWRPVVEPVQAVRAATQSLQHARLGGRQSVGANMHMQDVEGRRPTCLRWLPRTCGRCWLFSRRG